MGSGQRGSMLCCSAPLCLPPYPPMAALLTRMCPARLRSMDVKGTLTSKKVQVGVDNNTKTAKVCRQFGKASLQLLRRPAMQLQPSCKGTDVAQAQLAFFTAAFLLTVYR